MHQRECLTNMTVVDGIPSYGRSSNMSKISDDQVPFSTSVVSAPSLGAPICVSVPCQATIAGGR
jgi:hypothetical protein